MNENIAIEWVNTDFGCYCEYAGITEPTEKDVEDFANLLKEVVGIISDIRAAKLADRRYSPASN